MSDTPVRLQLPDGFILVVSVPTETREAISTLLVHPSVQPADIREYVEKLNVLLANKAWCFADKRKSYTIINVHRQHSNGGSPRNNDDAWRTELTGLIGPRYAAAIEVNVNQEYNVRGSLTNTRIGIRFRYGTNVLFDDQTYADLTQVDDWKLVDNIATGMPLRWSCKLSEPSGDVGVIQRTVAEIAKRLNVYLLRQPTIVEIECVRHYNSRLR